MFCISVLQFLIFSQQIKYLTLNLELNVLNPHCHCLNSFQQWSAVCRLSHDTQYITFWVKAIKPKKAQKKSYCEKFVRNSWLLLKLYKLCLCKHCFDLN